MCVCVHVARGCLNCHLLTHRSVIFTQLRAVHYSAAAYRWVEACISYLCPKVEQFLPSEIDPCQFVGPPLSLSPLQKLTPALLPNLSRFRMCPILPSTLLFPDCPAISHLHKSSLCSQLLLEPAHRLTRLSLHWKCLLQYILSRITGLQNGLGWKGP